VRIEINCNRESQFQKMMDEIHNSKSDFNFEVAARLWYTENDITVMVEHQVTTKTCKELVEDDSEPDWLTGYLVENEYDLDCSDEIFTETIEDNIKLQGLKDSMLDFAKVCIKRVSK
jgi:hypothetical protein